MDKPYFESIAPRSFLSFGPKSEPVALENLNVLIGPNGSGKSNLIEAFELLRATAGNLASFIRQGGGPGEFIWKGRVQRKPRIPVAIVPPGRTHSSEIIWSAEELPARSAGMETTVARIAQEGPLQYRLEFTEASQRLEIVDEAIEETKPRKKGDPDVYYYYRFQRGRPTISIRQLTPANDVEDKPESQHTSGASSFWDAAAEGFRRQLKREDLDPQQSVLSQRCDPDLYPEITTTRLTFARIVTFREWSFGRHVALRAPQPADLPSDSLLPDLSNLGLVLNDLAHSDRWKDFKALLRRFFPRFSDLSIRVQAGHVQIYLHEAGLSSAIPATRLSDGTLHFIALLVILMRPEVASLICIEEPDLGLHPDAVALLAPILVEASRVTQIVVTTHSDALVSALTGQPESVLVADHHTDGTHFIRLEADKLRSWLKKYQLGEIWRMGELGGNP
ncbi:MAG: AAA family ATPase [Candidatus Riflebacteria bacterium]|nr:AAA family ATPase [Candidatus Riflebacteria bacterium]